MKATPIPVPTVRWRCPCCGTTRAKKATVAAHIGRCWLNPAVRSCKTCVHLDVDHGGTPCFPGRPCECNRGGRDCAAGVDLEDGDVRTGCPKWTEAER